ncbi:hypothetical protein SAMN02910262_02651 [[Clostridium] aminophilum]|uniref:Uncharacterized protein n=1 Tax=[Clostridium] aminophilum TaxID=1526 RepID=A0A1I6KLW6_9FIRM|nr:hypothetical protein SAMN02910262_02651 [[Clostridium] aminophilum]
MDIETFTIRLIVREKVIIMCNSWGKRKAPYDSGNYHTVPIEYFNSNLNTFTLPHIAGEGNNNCNRN